MAVEFLLYLIKYIFRIILTWFFFTFLLIKFCVLIDELDTKFWDRIKDILQNMEFEKRGTSFVPNTDAFWHWNQNCNL